MAYSVGSTFSFSFVGYADIAEAEKAADQMEEWFKNSYPDWKEWQVNKAVTKTARGYAMAFDAVKESTGA